MEPVKLYVINDGVRAGMTQRAFDIVEEKELMRAWTLAFGVAHQPQPTAFHRLIRQDSMFELNGQLFDSWGIETLTGATGITHAQTLHVSYRLNKYILQPGYSKLGTIAQIAQDILDTALDPNGQPASSEFSLGQVRPSGTVAFALDNEQEVTVRSALLGLQAIGAEVSFNNFTIDLPERVGAEVGKTFEFGVDLISFRRSWTRDDGATYEVDYAELGDALGLGDNVTVKDKFLNDTITRRVVKRIICHDQPQNNSVTLGVFIRDSSTNARDMRAEINMKITEGEKYNNVSINRIEGFVAESDNGQFKTTQGGEDGFAAWVKEGEVWVKKSFLTVHGIVVPRVSNHPSDFHFLEVGVNSEGAAAVIFHHSNHDYLKMLPYSDGEFIFATPGGMNIEIGPGESANEARAARFSLDEVYLMRNRSWVFRGKSDETVVSFGSTIMTLKSNIIEFWINGGRRAYIDSTGIH